MPGTTELEAIPVPVLVTLGVTVPKSMLVLTVTPFPVLVEMPVGGVTAWLAALLVVVLGPWIASTLLMYETTDVVEVRVGLDGGAGKE